jgi:hypothetical protein
MSSRRTKPRSPCTLLADARLVHGRLFFACCAWVPLACALWACGESDGHAAQPDGGNDARLEIGQGETAFAPLQDGDTLVFEHGAQGGEHVYISLRITGLGPMRVLLEARTQLEGREDLVLERRGRLTFTPVSSTCDAGDDDACAPRFEYIGWPAQILGARDHPGERAQIVIDVTDLEGVHAQAKKTIVLAAPD